MDRFLWTRMDLSMSSKPKGMAEKWGLRFCLVLLLALGAMHTALVGVTFARTRDLLGNLLEAQGEHREATFFETFSALNPGPPDLREEPEREDLLVRYYAGEFQVHTRELGFFLVGAALVVQVKRLRELKRSVALAQAVSKASETGVL